MMAMSLRDGILEGGWICMGGRMMFYVGHARLTEANNFVKAKQQPYFARLVKIRKLPPEQQEQQRHLRRVIQELKTRIVGLEDFISSLRNSCASIEGAIEPLEDDPLPDTSDFATLELCTPKFIPPKTPPKPVMTSLFSTLKNINYTALAKSAEVDALSAELGRINFNSSSKGGGKKMNSLLDLDTPRPPRPDFISFRDEERLREYERVKNILTSVSTSRLVSVKLSSVYVPTVESDDSPNQADFSMSSPHTPPPRLRSSNPASITQTLSPNHSSSATQTPSIGDKQQTLSKLYQSPSSVEEASESFIIKCAQSVEDSDSDLDESEEAQFSDKSFDEYSDKNDEYLNNSGVTQFSPLQEVANDGANADLSCLNLGTSFAALGDTFAPAAPETPSHSLVIGGKATNLILSTPDASTKENQVVPVDEVTKISSLQSGVARRESSLISSAFSLSKPPNESATFKLPTIDALPMILPSSVSSTSALTFSPSNGLDKSMSGPTLFSSGQFSTTPSFATPIQSANNPSVSFGAGLKDVTQVFNVSNEISPHSAAFTASFTAVPPTTTPAFGLGSQMPIAPSFAPSGFGNPSTFASTPPSSTSAFGASTFSASPAAPSAFGAPAFGSPAFGAPTSSVPAFGAPAFGQSSFGGKEGTFGGSTFGSTAFGHSPHGTPINAAVFGNSSFGQPASKFSLSIPTDSVLAIKIYPPPQYLATHHPLRRLEPFPATRPIFLPQLQTRLHQTSLDLNHLAATSIPLDPSLHPLLRLLPQEHSVHQTQTTHHPHPPLSIPKEAQILLNFVVDEWIK